MSKLDIIKEILNNNHKPVDQLNLIEMNLDARGRRFTVNYPIIKQRAVEHALFRFDPNEIDFFPYFSDVSGLKKICDYFLFVEKDDYLYVFVIELKGRGSAQKQLLASEEFVKYILNSARRIGRYLNENIAIRRIRISDNKIRKRKTNDRNDFDYIDNYCDYPYQTFYLEPLMHF